MVILIQCKDSVGLVAGISGVVAQQGINIVSMREHVDGAENRFFTRIVAEGVRKPEALEQVLQNVLPEDAEVIVNPSPAKKIVVMVTKEYHCLGDILLRNHFKTLGADVQCVIGNHDVLSDVCERFEVPFHHISAEGKSRDNFESAVLETLASYQPDYLVLAKFMRILSPSFVEKYQHSIINIHHSFLPAFVGASPYRQAYERGVKLIGATAHFVTNNLDEGPIIAQQIIPVNHSFSVTDMVKAGKEIETAVLARAMQLVFEERVLIWKNRTIVFD